MNKTNHKAPAPKTGTNYTAAEVGALADLMGHSVKGPGFSIDGKVFLHDLLGLTSAEISLNLLPPGADVPFVHTHRQNEEVYRFVGGRGEFQIDGQAIPVREGTMVRVAPAGKRAWRNTSDAPLYFVVIQSKAGSLGQYAGGDGDIVPGPVTW
jgi:uncharacterized cupin superfamily protein